MPTHTDPPIDATADKVTAYRIERFEEIGFTHSEAKQLALLKDDKNVLIRVEAAKSLVDAGCKHVTAIRILT